MKAMRLVPEGDGFSLSPGLRADPAKVAELLKPAPGPHVMDVERAARHLETAASLLIATPKYPYNRSAVESREAAYQVALQNMREVLGNG